MPPRPQSSMIDAHQAKDQLASASAESENCSTNVFYYLSDENMYWGSFAFLAIIILLSQVLAFPVLFQMVAYTFPILYIGSHLSLLQKEINPETGEKQMKTEAMSHNDAMLFPFIGSAALLSLYLAYKFLPSYWVNLLLTLYLTLFGCVAMGATVNEILVKFTPLSWGAVCLKFDFRFPAVLDKYLGSIEIEATPRNILGHVIGTTICIVWLATKNWTLHNLFAIGFCLQGIKMVSVGNFKVACILLSGLFVYDIFWVFGTDVMVTVAKSFEAPAKLIFPISHNPWKQSILGLGDIVIPGIFIAMVLRFDHHLHEQKYGLTEGNPAFDIHQRFPKFYFWCNMLAYESGLLTTGAVMLISHHAQPALLYLVPFCLIGLFAPAFYLGELHALMQYTEEEPEKEKDEQEAATTESKKNI